MSVEHWTSYNKKRDPPLGHKAEVQRQIWDGQGEHAFQALAGGVRSMRR